MEPAVAERLRELEVADRMLAVQGEAGIVGDTGQKTHQPIRVENVRMSTASLSAVASEHEVRVAIDLAHSRVFKQTKDGAAQKHPQTRQELVVDHGSGSGSRR
jgi:hypothetical protein